MYRVVVDARMILNGQPVAFATIGGRPWLAHHLEAAKKASVLGTTVVWTPEHWEERFRDLLTELGSFPGVLIAANPGGLEGAAILQVNQVFVPHKLAHCLRKRRTGFSSAFICSIESSEDLKKAEDYVSRDKKLVLSRHFNMPMARALAQLLTRTTVAPNHVTVAALLFGLGASASAGVGAYWYDLAAAISLQAALTLDLTDGYLARLKNQTSRFGHWLDTIVDEITSFGIIIGIVIGLIWEYGPMPWAVFGGVWLLSFHVISTNFWFSKDFGLSPFSSAFTTATASRGIVSYGINLARGILSLSQGLDSKFHIISLGLLLNLKPQLVVFMAGAHLATLLLVFAGRYKTRANAN